MSWKRTSHSDIEAHFLGGGGNHALVISNYEMKSQIMPYWDKHVKYDIKSQNVDTLHHNYEIKMWKLWHTKSYYDIPGQNSYKKKDTMTQKVKIMRKYKLWHTK